jgi:hypothetical protein
VVCIVTDNCANIRKAVRSMQDCTQEKETARRLKAMADAKAKPGRSIEEKAVLSRAVTHCCPGSGSRPPVGSTMR